MLTLSLVALAVVPNALHLEIPDPGTEERVIVITQDAIVWRHIWSEGDRPVHGRHEVCWWTALTWKTPVQCREFDAKDDKVMFGAGRLVMLWSNGNMEDMMPLSAENTERVQIFPATQTRAPPVDSRQLPSNFHKPDQAIFWTVHAGYLTPLGVANRWSSRQPHLIEHPTGGWLGLSRGDDHRIIEWFDENGPQTQIKVPKVYYGRLQTAWPIEGGFRVFSKGGWGLGAEHGYIDLEARTLRRMDQPDLLTNTLKREPIRRSLEYGIAFLIFASLLRRHWFRYPLAFMALAVAIHQGVPLLGLVVGEPWYW